MKKQHKIVIDGQEITLTLDESLNGIKKSEASKRRVAELNTLFGDLKYPLDHYLDIAAKEGECIVDDKSKIVCLTYKPK